jgi:hypothetical protein
MVPQVRIPGQQALNGCLKWRIARMSFSTPTKSAYMAHSFPTTALDRDVSAHVLRPSPIRDGLLATHELHEDDFSSSGCDSDESDAAGLTLSPQVQALLLDYVLCRGGWGAVYVCVSGVYADMCTDIFTPVYIVQCECACTCCVRSCCRACLRLQWSWPYMPGATCKHPFGCAGVHIMLQRQAFYLTLH